MSKQVRTKDGRVHRIVRGLISASTCVHGINIRAAVTHLDHMSSAERLTRAATRPPGLPLAGLLPVGLVAPPPPPSATTVAGANASLPGTGAGPAAGGGSEYAPPTTITAWPRHVEFSRT